MNIIPAIDIINGKCVRLSKGNYNTAKLYSDDPVKIAEQFAAAGFKRLHMVDLDGARSGKIMNLKVLQHIAAVTGLSIDFSGGIKSTADVQTVFKAGASFVSVGSVAVKQPQLLKEWLQEFGASNFLVGADVFNEEVKISGWQQGTGINIFDFTDILMQLGVLHIFCTDISKDGMMQGPAVELYKKLIALHPQINLIASGGVTTIDDIIKLEEAGCSGTIIGKAIYENLISLQQLLTYNS